MDRLSAPDEWLTRLVIQRGLGVIYLAAFLVAVNQFRPLLGERGLLPAPRFLAQVTFLQAPSLFHWRYSDRFLLAVAWTGVLASVAVVLGLPEAGPAPVSMLVWFALWAFYLSITNIGQVFYAFGWESLLCEAGFLAIFLGPSSSAPPVIVIWLFRWLLFRLEFGAGLIKLRGDRCWRDLTCLVYHHETQPMPNPLSWYFHRLPRVLHRAEVLGNHFAQVVAPWGLFAPQPVASVAGLVMFATQGWLVMSGNFSWLNAVALVLCVSAIDSSWIHRVIPVSPPDGLTATPVWQAALSVALAVFVGVLSYWPVRNLVSRHQLMNTSFNTFHLVNTYGAFGSVTRVRREVVIEGTSEEVLSPETVWREYEFKGKPGDVRRRPPQVAPYHLRLDWLMWFAALSPSYARSWLAPFLAKLLEGDRATLRLLRRNPFPEAPPRYARALLYEYRFTTWAERKATGAWWSRSRLGEYAGPVALARDALPYRSATSSQRLV